MEKSEDMKKLETMLNEGRMLVMCLGLPHEPCGKITYSSPDDKIELREWISKSDDPAFYDRIASQYNIKSEDVGKKPVSHGYCPRCFDNYFERIGTFRRSSQ